jgi:K+-transporting ATPase ATPase C chain
MQAHTSTRQLIRPAILALVLFTLLTGVLYPLLITGIAQVAFRGPANGGLVTNSAGVVVGSRLIGQEFDQPQYFWGRLSATSPAPYNAAASSGSNLGPLNPSLIGEDGIVQKRIAALKAADKAAGVANDAPLPADLVTASASGLDPQISPAAAAYQAARVAAVRGAPVDEIKTLIAKYTEGRTFGLLGEDRVNVLLLNLALDERYPVPAH